MELYLRSCTPNRTECRVQLKGSPIGSPHPLLDNPTETCQAWLGDQSYFAMSICILDSSIAVRRKGRRERWKKSESFHELTVNHEDEMISASWLLGVRLLVFVLFLCWWVTLIVARWRVARTCLIGLGTCSTVSSCTAGNERVSVLYHHFLAPYLLEPSLFELVYYISITSHRINCTDPARRYIED